MKEKRIPIIVGAAQFTQQKEAPLHLDPLNLMAKTSELAIKKSGNKALKEKIDALYIMNIHSWSYRDVASDLSKLIGITPINKSYMSIGGHIPQKIVNQAARELALGKSEIVLITGGEAFHSASLAKRGKLTLNWPKRRRPKFMEGPIQPLDASSFEHKYDLLIPVKIYSLIETALTAASGRSMDSRMKRVGKVLEHLSRIANKNPFAWTHDIFTAEDINTPTLMNRYICLPYTKRMIANRFVDQSAALVMTTEAIAETLGIEKELWVYPMGGADLQNIKYISQRPKLYDSPAIREASRLSLKQAGLTVGDINKFDLYSCFPCMIEIARQEIGIPEDDSRDLTITGGLPFFGGPFSNYSLHSIATAVDLIREKPSLKILITATGGYNTKLSVGIYGKASSAEPWGERDDSIIQESIYSKSLPEPVEKANGIFTIEAYTIIYNRSNQPEVGIAFGRLENGSRTLAKFDSKLEELIEFEHQELVGHRCKIYLDSTSGYNLIILN